MNPAPRLIHQRAVLTLAAALKTYCDTTRTLEAMISPADISWGDDTLVQPDVFVVPRHEAPSGDWRRIRTLLLVIEVLRPGTARHDRFTKRRLYHEQGIPNLWLVDLDAACVEAWTPTDRRPVIVRDTLSWPALGVGLTFELATAALMRTD